MSNLSGRGQLTGTMRSGGGTGGTTNYNDLTNKPKINNVELSGNKTTSDLNISYEDLTNKPTIRNVPETTGAELGSVLTHTASGEAWLSVPSELPPVASGDDGDVLTLEDGSLVWAPVNGGSIEYTTNERVVGTWLDGSPLYSRTWEFSTPIDASGYNWTDTPISVAATGIYLITDSDAISTAGMKLNYISATTDLGTQTYVRLYNNRSANSQVKYLTITYTKVGE